MHSNRAVRNQIPNSGLESYLQENFERAFFYMVYSRSIEEFNNEEKHFIDIFTTLCKSSDKVSSNKSKFEQLFNYFNHKLCDKKKWAYVWRQDDLVGTNMSQERFHGQLKNQFPNNGAPRVYQLIYII